MPTGLTRKNCAPLLRTVLGKPHATDRHHEESETQQDSSAEWKHQSKEEEDINAEPMLSDDELTVPAPRQALSARPKISTPPLTDDLDLTRPQRKPARKKPEIQRPSPGLYAKGRADKAKRSVDNNKENANSTQSSTTTSDDNGFSFDMFSLPVSKKQKTQKVQYGTKQKVSSSNLNIHARPLGKSGRAPSKEELRSKKGKGQKRPAESMEEDDLSDVSIMSLEELSQELSVGSPNIQDPDLHTKEPRNRPPRPEGKSDPAALNDTELIKLLDERSKAPRLIYQLGDWVQGQAPSVSQPTSGAPEESLHQISEYIEQLHQVEDEGTRCALCEETVNQEDSWEFWKDKERTVKNHTAFCNMHKRRSAQDEYEREGYPTIDWKKLPKRIRKHRTELFAVFTNDRPSEHRDRYEPLALTGKAAAVPAKRKDLPESLQEELESYALDDQSTYPGYYGPLGRRLITENVMKVLKNEVKQCNDPVVQGSGPAAFIQAVIVPEAAILLIMEDCHVDRQDAEAIRQKTYDIGLLLNEEIEDQVEAQHSDEDDNNEYHDS